MVYNYSHDSREGVLLELGEDTPHLGFYGQGGTKNIYIYTHTHTHLALNLGGGGSQGASSHINKRPSVSIITYHCEYIR